MRVSKCVCVRTSVHFCLGAQKNICTGAYHQDVTLLPRSMCWDTIWDATQCYLTDPPPAISFTKTGACGNSGQLFFVVVVVVVFCFFFICVPWWSLGPGAAAPVAPPILTPLDQGIKHRLAKPDFYWKENTAHHSPAAACSLWGSPDESITEAPSKASRCLIPWTMCWGPYLYCCWSLMLFWALFVAMSGFLMVVSWLDA